MLGHLQFSTSNLSVGLLSSAFSIDIEVETYQLCCCQPCEATIISYLAHYSESPSPTGASLITTVGVLASIKSHSFQRDTVTSLLKTNIFAIYHRS